MVVLDTNVISELMKESPDDQVTEWFSQTKIETLYTTAITMAELHYGVQNLPDGKRKIALKKVLDGLSALFKGRILSFDESCCSEYARIIVLRSELGNPISTLDGQIAAICCSHKMPVITRNENDFMGVGLKVVNPWLGS